MQGETIWLNVWFSAAREHVPGLWWSWHNFLKNAIATLQGRHWRFYFVSAGNQAAAPGEWERALAYPRVSLLCLPSLPRFLLTARCGSLSSSPFQALDIYGVPDGAPFPPEATLTFYPLMCQKCLLSCLFWGYP